jgi:hypothetical protein
VALAAPPNEGQWSWSVRFAATELDLPHEDCSAVFNLRTVRPPEHRLTVRVVASETSEPIDDAHIRIGAYRAVTDPAGRAEIELPKGRYELFVWKAGFEAPEQTVQIDADINVEVAAITLPEEDPDAIWA